MWYCNVCGRLKIAPTRNGLLMSVIRVASKWEQNKLTCFAKQEWIRKTIIINNNFYRRQFLNRWHCYRR